MLTTRLSKMKEKEVHLLREIWPFYEYIITHSKLDPLNLSVNRKAILVVNLKAVN